MYARSGAIEELYKMVTDNLNEAVDEDLEATWQDEIRRPSGDVRCGKVKAIPWNEVRDSAHTSLTTKHLCYYDGYNIVTQIPLGVSRLNALRAKRISMC
jgi:hypothetical protein